MSTHAYTDNPPESIRTSVRVAGLASVGAGIIHGFVTPDHWNEWLPLGIGFAALAAGQVGAGLLALLRSSRPTIAALSLVNLAAVGGIAVAVTTGLPAGPTAGTPEELGWASGLAAALALATLLGTAWALLVPARTGTWRPAVRGAILGGAFLAVTAAVVPSVAIGDGHTHSHGDESHETDDHGHEDGDDHGHEDEEPTNASDTEVGTDPESTNKPKKKADRHGGAEVDEDSTPVDVEDEQTDDSHEDDGHTH